MCDFYIITVTDLDGLAIAEDQFGPDSEYHVPEKAVCTCGMWHRESDGSRPVFLALVEHYLLLMPYGILTIEKNP